MFYKHHSSFDSNMIKKRKLTMMQRSTLDLFLADVNVYIRRHKSALFHTQFR